MAIYICPACHARSERQGSCIVCGGPLGSVTKAVAAATVASISFGGVWLALALSLGVWVGWLALFYGALVSGVVTWYSGGRGLLFQAIASLATLAGIVAADVLSVWLLWDTLAGRDRPDRPTVADLLTWMVQYDAGTIAFALLGLFGGLWIWRESGE